MRISHQKSKSKGLVVSVTSISFTDLKSRLRQRVESHERELKKSSFPVARVAVHCEVLLEHAREQDRLLSAALWKMGGCLARIPSFRRLPTS
jgi:hypothetical protein